MSNTLFRKPTNKDKQYLKETVCKNLREFIDSLYAISDESEDKDLLSDQNLYTERDMTYAIREYLAQQQRINAIHTFELLRIVSHPALLYIELKISTFVYKDIIFNVAYKFRGVEGVENVTVEELRQDTALTS